jgi:hypothetical protein
MISMQCCPVYACIGLKEALSLDSSSKKKRKLIPTLDGDYWMIGDNPDLGALGGGKNQQCVDHNIFQTDDGVWYLWGCIRGTSVGRVLYLWQAPRLTDCHWQQTGEIIRADRSMGESVEDWFDEEWIQSPYFVKTGGTYFMFYGGHGTGITKGDAEIPGKRKMLECQICVMTSHGGRKWTRHLNGQGQSRLFVGPGEARDPNVLKIGGVWHLYYTGHETDGNRVFPAIFVRTSRDLINWSDYKIVHNDCSPKFGASLWNSECPHVIEKEGYFYLFRTEDYGSAMTHVFRSEDPYDFGIGNAEDKYVGRIEAAAPEIIFDAVGNEYISSNHDLTGGTRLCRLKWLSE